MVEPIRELWLAAPSRKRRAVARNARPMLGSCGTTCPTAPAFVHTRGGARGARKRMRSRSHRGSRDHRSVGRSAARACTQPECVYSESRPVTKRDSAGPALRVAPTRRGPENTSRGRAARRAGALHVGAASRTRGPRHHHRHRLRRPRALGPRGPFGGRCGRGTVQSELPRSNAAPPGRERT